MVKMLAIVGEAESGNEREREGGREGKRVIRREGRDA